MEQPINASYWVQLKPLLLSFPMSLWVTCMNHDAETDDWRLKSRLPTLPAASASVAAAVLCLCKQQGSGDAPSVFIDANA